VEERGILRATATGSMNLAHERVRRLVLCSPEPARRQAAVATAAIALLVAAACLLAPGLRLVPSSLSAEIEGAVVTMRRVG
jgi:hypothetical protein